MLTKLEGGRVGGAGDEEHNVEEMLKLGAYGNCLLAHAIAGLYVLFRTAFDPRPFFLFQTIASCCRAICVTPVLFISVPALIPRAFVGRLSQVP